MLRQPRQSILTRPLKPTSQKNVENADTEYNQSQQRIVAKQQRFSEQEEWRRKCLDCTPQEKVQMWAEKQREQREHLSLKRQHQVSEKLHDRTLVNYGEQHQEYCARVEREQEMTKKQQMRQVMQENMRMAETKKVEAAMRRAVEIATEREEKPFWDRLPRSYR